MAYKTNYAKQRGFHGRIKMLETLFSINVLKITLHSAKINTICKNLSNNMLSMTCDSQYGRIIPPLKLAVLLEK
jgi:hypothetical protein